MNFVHQPLNQTDSVRAPSLWIIGFLHHNCGNIPKLTGQLRFSLLPSDLKLPFIQDLQHKKEKTQVNIVFTKLIEPLTQTFYLSDL